MKLHLYIQPLIICFQINECCDKAELIGKSGKPVASAGAAAAAAPPKPAAAPAAKPAAAKPKTVGLAYYARGRHIVNKLVQRQNMLNLYCVHLVSLSYSDLLLIIISANKHLLYAKLYVYN